jgi:hypothetical protein
VPRVSHVDFSVSVGTIVPTHVHFVDVPSTLIEIHPEWRGHKYIVVEDEIVILTPERRIVAVVPVGGGSSAGVSSSNTTVAIADLPPDEIRVIQEVLVRRGFRIEVTGRFDNRTREALIKFQRREGLRANGRIDTRTVTKLGVQDKVKLDSRDRQNAATSRENQDDQQQRGDQAQGQRDKQNDQAQDQRDKQNDQAQGQRGQERDQQNQRAQGQHGQQAQGQEGQQGRQSTTGQGSNRQGSQGSAANRDSSDQHQPKAGNSDQRRRGSDTERERPTSSR